MSKAKFVAILALLLSTSVIHAEDACEGMLELAIDAALGEPTAQYNLAVRHWQGKCVDKDLSVSRTLWQKAASSGIADAYNNYGYLLYYGEGGETDYEGGIAAWERGVELGSTEAFIQLANANLDERHLLLDVSRARILASAAKKCALSEKSETHVEMADEVLSQTGTKISRREESKIKALALACLHSDD